VIFGGVSTVIDVYREFQDDMRSELRQYEPDVDGG